MAEKNFVRIYVNANSSKKVDIIIKQYSHFMDIVESCTDGLQYMIQCEKESNNRHRMGELGIRVHTSGVSDPTAKSAIRNVITREAIINCDFSGDVLEGVNRAEEFMREAYLLRDMRMDYDLFKCQLSILGPEKELFEKFLCGKMTLFDIAEEEGISYEAAKQRIYRNRTRVKNQVMNFMKSKEGDIA